MLKYFLLAWLLVASVQAEVPTTIGIPDCVPTSMHYLGKTIQIKASLTDWMKVCETDNTGTDIDLIMPAWEKMSRGQSLLRPIYIVPLQAIPTLDARFDPFRRLANIDKPIQVGILQYLWVGFHKGVGKDDTMYLHCGVATFHPDRVHLISPNSQGADGKVLEEDWEYENFFGHTLLVFDIEIKAVRTSPSSKATF